MNPDYTTSQAWAHQEFHSPVPLPSTRGCPDSLHIDLLGQLNREKVTTGLASSLPCHILSVPASIPFCPILGPARGAVATFVLKEPLFVSLLGHLSCRRQQWWEVI